MNKDDSLYTFPRAQILTLLKENPQGLSKEEIANKTKINRTSVLHHIKILQDRKLVEVSKRKKGEGNRGAPMIVTITKKADPQTKDTLALFEKLTSIYKRM